jgi:predicted nucleic acid-binding protein
MVAAVCSWHEHHLRAVGAIEGRRGRRERMVVAAPALVETYAVLTRLPAPHRLSPEVALLLVEENFMRAPCVALDAHGYRSLIRGAPGAGVSGERTYDAVIALCARRARVGTLLTFDASHFAPFGGPDLAVVVPA